jgi:signal transduction histidine kinase
MTKYINKKSSDPKRAEREIYFTKNKNESADRANTNSFEQIKFAENFEELASCGASDLNSSNVVRDEQLPTMALLIDSEKKELDTMEQLVKKQTESIQNARRLLSDKQKLLQMELSKKSSRFSTNERLSLIGDLSVKMAHDIKNPITVLKSQVDLMKLRFSKDENSIMLDSLNRMDRAISIITNQFDDVLHFLKDEPQYDFSENNMRQILSDALFGIKIPSNVNLNLPENDVVLLCDRHKMQRVFVNLIQNSIHALENGGEISIGISENKEYVLIAIQDSGPGIAEDKMDKIFQPLFTTKKYGTGLGLVICKQILESHGGTISVKNNPTTFTMVIPKHRKT